MVEKETPRENMTELSGSWQELVWRIVIGALGAVVLWQWTQGVKNTTEIAVLKELHKELRQDTQDRYTQTEADNNLHELRAEDHYIREEISVLRENQILIRERLTKIEVEHAMRNYIKFTDISGRTIKAFRGRANKLHGGLELHFILFDDEKTLMEFSEQSPYDYHDCSDSAREVNVYEDEELWKKMYDEKNGYVKMENSSSPF